MSIPAVNELAAELWQIERVRYTYEVFYEASQQKLADDLDVMYQETDYVGYSKDIVKRLLVLGLPPHYVGSFVYLVPDDQVECCIEILEAQKERVDTYKLAQFHLENPWWYTTLSAEHAAEVTLRISDDLGRGCAIHTAITEWNDILSTSNLSRALSELLQGADAYDDTAQWCQWVSLYGLLISRGLGIFSKDYNDLAQKANNELQAFSAIATRALELGVTALDVQKSWRSLKDYGYLRYNKEVTDVFLHYATRQEDFKEAHERSLVHKTVEYGTLQRFAEIYRLLTAEQRDLAHGLIRTTDLDCYRICEVAADLL